MRVTLLAVSLLCLSGCVTGGESKPADDGLEEGEDPEEAKARSAAAKDAAAAVPGDVPPDPTIGELTLGRLEDEELRKSIYNGFEKRIARKTDLGDGQQEQTELGDYDSFQFTVTKLTSGEDDVSTDPTQPPDAMELEVTGWYKKSLVKGGNEPKSTCYSFDAMAPLVRKGQSWGLPDDYKVAFVREDNEDCY